MRTLQEYLIESSQQYEYRIKIAGELTQEQIEKMEQGMAAFDMVSLSEPKRTPIAENPLGFDIRVINKAFEVSMTDEEANKDRTPEDGALLDSDLPDSTQAQLDASKLYSTPGSEQDVIMNRAKSEFEVAGGKTEKAQTTNDLPQNNTSPFSSVTLLDRPKTGAKQ
jgi:hypothetical protein